MLLRDRERRWIGPCVVDPADRPGRVEAGGREVFLDWDRAVDDGGRLRRCPACGCEDLYATRRFGAAWVVVGVTLAFVAPVVLSGLDQGGMGALVGKLVCGVGVVVVLSAWLVSPRALVCYRCRSRYDRMPVSRQRRGWRQSVAARYRRPGAKES